jgi:hypothetical protein
MGACAAAGAARREVARRRARIEYSGKEEDAPV